MSKKTTFQVRVNHGPEHTIKVKSGVYKMAAAAVPALLGIDADAYPLRIEIWCESLIPEYGPYLYHIEGVGGEARHLIENVAWLNGGSLSISDREG